MFGLDMAGPNESNKAKYLSFRRMRLKQKLLDDLNPAFCNDQKWKPTKVALEYRSPKLCTDGFVTCKDLEDL